MDTDRNLFFGVLALQADLIDSAQFAEATGAWAARKDVPLAAILIERGWITAEEEKPVSSGSCHLGAAWYSIRHWQLPRHRLQLDSICGRNPWAGTSHYP